MLTRRLALRKETLAELTGDQLRGVAAASGASCVVVCTAQISDWVISLCGCLTDYCSIDVC
jgi:hypothetical protein